jgi:hypothetical protein
MIHHSLWVAAAFVAAAPLTAQIRVALCGAASTTNTACQWTSPQTALQATGLFAVVDIINVTTTGGGTPTLQQLLQYDALLCYTNSTPANNATWGDVLADYVDAGGGVVVAVFANSTTSAGRNIGGRWQAGYEVILDQGGNASGSGATLGTVLVPGHPVMAGVTSFLGGTVGSRPAATALEVGAFVVAQWSDGKILVAQGANPRRVDLGFYPPQASCSQSGWTTGGDQLMANALLAVGSLAHVRTYGAGCAGALGVPQFATSATALPVLGQVLVANVDNLPLGLAVVGLGVSDTSSGGLPLPLDLTPLGMPGCNLLADPLVTDLVAGTGPSVLWGLPIPLQPALVGLKLYGQAFSLDLPANAFGFTASNGARFKIGL